MSQWMHCLGNCEHLIGGQCAVFSVSTYCLGQSIPMICSTRLGGVRGLLHFYQQWRSMFSGEHPEMVLAGQAQFISVLHSPLLQSAILVCFLVCYQFCDCQSLLGLGKAYFYHPWSLCDRVINCHAAAWSEDCYALNLCNFVAGKYEIRFYRFRKKCLVVNLDYYCTIGIAT